MRMNSGDQNAHAKVKMPWFILLFVLAAVANTYLLSGTHLWHGLMNAGKIGLTVTLFLIGASLSPAQMKRVGVRPLLQGIVLWIIVAGVSLFAIRAGWISL